MAATVGHVVLGRAAIKRDPTKKPWAHFDPSNTHSMHALLYESDDFDKRTVFACGMQVHLYNSASIAPYLQAISANPNKLKEIKQQNIPVNVAYLIHPRDADYTFTESVAYNLLGQYYRKKALAAGAAAGAPPAPLVCVTFDLPNHGLRTVDRARNGSWSDGNETHAADMISIIDTAVEEVRLLMDVLPWILDPEVHLADLQAIEGLAHVGVEYINIVSGYSLGAHASIRLAAKYPLLVHVVNPVCGSSDLTTLLVGRLRQLPNGSTELQRKLFYCDYAELGLTPQQQARYPQPLHRHLSQQDANIFENLLASNVKLFASFGRNDQVVPAEISTLWADMYKLNNPRSETFVQEGVEHDVTPEMVDQFISWLVGVVP